VSVMTCVALILISLSGFSIKTRKFSFSYDGLLVTLYRAMFNKEIEED
jgi:hypothetical protein